MLSVQRCATRRVRRNDRGLADFIGHGQLRTQLPGLARDVGTVLMGVNGVSQRGQALLQSGFFRLGRHGCNQTSQRLERFLLRAKSGLVRDAARLHRVRVIRADEIEQVQRLRRTFGGCGQQLKAARRQQRQHQPGQETGGGNHE
ncbi:hypothetical protein D3C78_1516540 [compost metagenome]